MIERSKIDRGLFNDKAELPFQLRLRDFEVAMEDIYDFFFDVNSELQKKGLQRLDDMLRPAIMSGLISDMLTASLAKHSRTLTENKYFNGHPDLVVRGRYPDDSVKSGEEGVEIKTTRKSGGAVDTHGARDQWMCVFVYSVDTSTEPAVKRRSMIFEEVYLGNVKRDDFGFTPVFTDTYETADAGPEECSCRSEGSSVRSSSAVLLSRQASRASAAPRWPGSWGFATPC